MRPVFLVGMPGAGKTYWGRIWSGMTGLPWTDLDQEIEAVSGAPVPEIIARRGEQGFRDLESEVLARLVETYDGKAAIISCGGGTPTIALNLQLMLERGCVVYLEADPPQLLAQLSASDTARPLLRELTERALADLLRRRKVFYQQAHVIVPIGKASAGTFAEIQQICINRHS